MFLLLPPSFSSVLMTHAYETAKPLEHSCVKKSIVIIQCHQKKNLNLQSKCCFPISFFLTLYVLCFYLFSLTVHRKSNKSKRVGEPFKNNTVQVQSNALQKCLGSWKHRKHRKQQLQWSWSPPTAVNIWAVTSSEFTCKEISGWCLKSSQQER